MGDLKGPSRRKRRIEDYGILPDPVIEVYKRDVDRTLIHDNLKLSVEERCQRLMAHQQLAEELQRAGRELRRES